MKGLPGTHLCFLAVHQRLDSRWISTTKTKGILPIRQRPESDLLDRGNLLQRAVHFVPFQPRDPFPHFQAFGACGHPAQLPDPLSHNKLNNKQDSYKGPLPGPRANRSEGIPKENKHCPLAAFHGSFFGAFQRVHRSPLVSSVHFIAYFLLQPARASVEGQQPTELWPAAFFLLDFYLIHFLGRIIRFLLMSLPIRNGALKD